MDLFKVPGVAETLDWVGSLVALSQVELEVDAASDSLGALLKYQDDIQKVHAGDTLKKLVQKVRGLP
jgi:hypothetical protein